MGSLAHWILARWPSGKNEKTENFESELEYYLNDREIILRLPVHIRDAWRNVKNKKILFDLMMKFARSDTGIEIRNNIKNIKREYRFNIKLNKTSMAGAIDAFYGNTLIDYKLTSVNDAPEGLYESQLDFYALAAHELTGLDEIRTVAVFLREGISKERICNDFEGIKARVLGASEKCASGDLPPELKSCVKCPFAKKCAFSIRN